MNKKLLIVAAVSVVVVIIIITVVAVSSGGKGTVVTTIPHESKYENSADISSSTIAIVETYTEIYGPTTSEPVDEIPLENNVELNVRCLSHSGISESSLRNIVYGNIGEDTSTKNYLLCVLKGMGILSRSGGFSVNSTRLKHYSPNINDDDVERFKNMCESKIGHTPGDTAVLVVATQINDDVDVLNSVPQTDEDRVRKLLPIAMSCTSQSGITAEEARLIKYGVIGENRSSKEFIFCLLNKFGVVNEDGEIFEDTSALRRTFGTLANNDKAENVMAACQGVKGGTPTDAAVLVYKCIKGIK